MDRYRQCRGSNALDGDVDAAGIFRHGIGTRVELDVTARRIVIDDRQDSRVRSDEVT